MPVDYAVLCNAYAYYSAQCNSNCNFKRVDAPWSVRLEAMKATAPGWAQWYPHQDGKYFVASGEQSFIQVLMQGDLEPGRYSCLTPCFRGDDEDEIHQPYFMKVELWDNKDVSDKNLKSVIDAALWWFNSAVKIPCKAVEVEPADWDVTTIPGTAFDIVDAKHGIELGSYGIRDHDVIGNWIYGTGHAEPRASYVKGLLDDTSNVG